MPAPADGRRRVDAARNRDRLVEVATEVFARGDVTTLDAIAKAAGVGIGTLYRHFPTREALVEAVYRGELDAVVDEAVHPPAGVAPDAALRAWMDRYAAFVRTKRGMADSLRAVLAAGAGDDTRPRLREAVAGLLARGVDAGVLRGDVDPDDVVGAMLGACLATPREDQAPQTARLLDLLLDALRAR